MMTILKRISKFIFVAVFAIFILQNCTDDDHTGYSTLVPVEGVSISVDYSFPSPRVLVEDGSVFEFVITLSEAMNVDVIIYLTQTAGDAEEGNDFDFTHSVLIPAGNTTGTASITIHEDDLIEDTESITIKIGDDRTANATIKPATAKFVISNATSDDLVVGLNWDVSNYDLEGTLFEPTDVADLRLLVTDNNNPYTTILGGADGGSFEIYEMLDANFPDGEYFVVADFYDAMEIIQDDIQGVDLDLVVTFNQQGIINDLSFEFPAALNTESFCEEYSFILAKIIKVGNTYSMEPVGSVSEVDNSSLVGVWYGTDTEFAYPSQVETKLNGTALTIVGLGFGWMEDFWGETVIDSTFVTVEVDWCAKTVNIPEQDYITTLWSGDPYPYTIVGSGTFDDSGAFPTMTIEFDMIQEGFSTAGWTHDNGHMSTPLFVATLTLDPAGLPVP